MVDSAKMGVAFGAVKEKGTHPQADIAHEPPCVPGFVGPGTGHHFQKYTDGIFCGTPLEVTSIRHGARIECGAARSAPAASVLFPSTKVAADKVEIHRLGNTLIGSEKSRHGFWRTGRVVPLDPTPWDPRKAGNALQLFGKS